MRYPALSYALTLQNPNLQNDQCCNYAPRYRDPCSRSRRLVHQISRFGETAHIRQIDHRRAPIATRLRYTAQPNLNGRPCECEHTRLASPCRSQSYYAHALTAGNTDNPGMCFLAPGLTRRSNRASRKMPVRRSCCRSWSVRRKN